MGQTTKAKFSVKPSGATIKDLKYKSSDTSVATVDEKGNVTGVSVGKATITASTTDGSDKSASCTVTVKMKDDVGVTKIDKDGFSVTLISVRTTKGKNYFKADSGNVFVLPTF